MNIQVDEQKQAISDDQELAKALAGVNDDVNSMGYEPIVSNSGLTQPQSGLGAATDNQVVTPLPEPVVDPQTYATPVVATPADSGLANVKQAALTELRPLIDKLDVDPEEKFNTYLLLIRSTDDKDLIAPAHEAAKAIADETKKAQALLDIIKEIDFLSNPSQQ